MARMGFVVGILALMIMLAWGIYKAVDSMVTYRMAQVNIYHEMLEDIYR